MTTQSDSLERTTNADLSRTAATVVASDLRTARRVVDADLADRRADREADRRRREDADRRTDRDRRRADRRRIRSERTARRRAWIADRIDYCRTNAPGVYSSAVYGASIVVAVVGQVSAATNRNWPIAVGFGIAIFVEGMAMAMALTAHQLRFKRERALLPRTLTWVFALFAAGVNFTSHDSDIVLACVWGASSLAGITLWEVRSGAKNRPVLRKLGALPEPAERFGVRRWLRFPHSTFQAWSLDIRDRVTPNGARLLAEVERRRTQRSEDRNRRRLVRAAAFAVRMSAVRGPGPAAEALRSAVDLLAQSPVRQPDRRPIREDRQPDRTTDRTTDRREDRGTDRRGPNPSPRNVSPIESARTGDDEYIAAIRNRYPSGPVSWSQVRTVVDEIDRPHNRTPSKSRYTRVLKKVNDESEDKERVA